MRNLKMYFIKKTLSEDERETKTWLTHTKTIYKHQRV